MTTATTALRVLLDPPGRGADNMRRDLELLESVIGGDAPTLRIYGFSPPCLSLGRLQDDTTLDLDACRTAGVDVVRRPTGGRAILHDAEVTYSVCARNDDPDLGGDVLHSCARIHAAVAAGLAHIGVATIAQQRSDDERRDGRARAAIDDCFARPASHELLDSEGCKLVGSAQCRRGDALLQHGSVLLAPPRAAVFFGEAIPVRQTRGICALLGRDVSITELRVALLAGFAAQLGDRIPH